MFIGGQGSTTKSRKSLRLPKYDYSRIGAYFVTICVSQRKNVLGTITNGSITIKDCGRIIQKVWESLPKRFPRLDIDAFVIMPNHVHGIIMVGAQFIAPGSGNLELENNFSPLNTKGVINHAPTVGEIIRTFKAASARIIRQNVYAKFSWQRNYYEHIIRDEESLNRIREYIAANPYRWDLDRENPRAIGKDDFDRWLATFKNAPDKSNFKTETQPRGIG